MNAQTARRRWGGSRPFPGREFKFATPSGTRSCGTRACLQPRLQSGHTALRALTGLSCPALAAIVQPPFLLATFGRYRQPQAPSPLEFYHAFDGKQGAAETILSASFGVVLGPLCPYFTAFLGKHGKGGRERCRALLLKGWFNFPRGQWYDGRTSIRCITAAMLRVTGACWG